MLYFCVLSPSLALYVRAKAQNLFDALADEALKEHHSGKTVDLRELAKK